MAEGTAHVNKVTVYLPRQNHRRTGWKTQQSVDLGSLVVTIKY